jgi:hypothetical protein
MFQSVDHHSDLAKTQHTRQSIGSKPSHKYHQLKDQQGCVHASFYKTRPQIPTRLLVAVLLLFFAEPTAAADDDLFASFRTHRPQHAGYQIPIHAILALLLVLGQYVAAFSGSLVGPLMGVTSVLWLMMRNDAAISPHAAWV